MGVTSRLLSHPVLYLRNMRRSFVPEPTWDTSMQSRKEAFSWAGKNPKRQKNIYVPVCWPMWMPGKRLWRKVFCIQAGRSESWDGLTTEMPFWIRMSRSVTGASLFFPNRHSLDGKTWILLYWIRRGTWTSLQRWRGLCRFWTMQFL